MSVVVSLSDYLKNHSLIFINGWTNSTVTAYCPAHAHGCYEMVLHARGSGQTKMEDGVTLAFSEGSVVIYPPSVLHDQHNTVPAIDVCLHFGPAKTGFSEFRTSILIEGDFPPYIAEEFAALAKPFPGMSVLEKLQFDHRVSALAAALCALPNEKPDLSRNTPAQRHAVMAFDFMKKNLVEAHDLKTVAAHCGISAEYLRHAFKKQFKTGFKEVLDKLRLEKARSLLLHSQLPVKAIADVCGFGSDRHFCSVFKFHQHCTPGQFRARSPH
jgi:AraC-like DNA-binding protein